VLADQLDFDQVIPHDRILASLKLFAGGRMPALREPGDKTPLTTTPTVETYRHERGNRAS
jgi:hypothetical protein